MAVMMVIGTALSRMLPSKAVALVLSTGGMAGAAAAFGTNILPPLLHHRYYYSYSRSSRTGAHDWALHNLASFLPLDEHCRSLCRLSHRHCHHNQKSIRLLHAFRGDGVGDDARSGKSNENFHNVPQDVRYSPSFQHEHQLEQVICQHFCHELLPEVKQLLLSAGEEHKKTNQARGKISLVLLLAVSGGADSIGLLRAMTKLLDHSYATKTIIEGSSDSVNITPPSRLRVLSCGDSNKDNESSEDIPCELHVVHFDHQQRGAESAGDREFVHQQCDSLDVPLECYYWDQDHPLQGGSNECKENRVVTGDNGPGEVKESGTENSHQTTKFSQDVARQWRRDRMRQRLRQLIQERRQRRVDASTNVPKEEETVVGVLLTAHHQDDSNETLLLKLLRGVHVTHLSGMQAVFLDEDGNAGVNGNNNTDDIDNCNNELNDPLVLWARPFLSVPKSCIVDYLSNNGWTWREDASNRSDKYLRNRVRNELLPIMSELAGGVTAFQTRLDHISQQSEELQEFLSARAQTYLNENCYYKEGIEEERSLLFSLPSGNCGLDLVHKQALFMWVMQTTNGYQFTFRHLDRLCNQLTDYPDNKLWRLNIGGGWDVIREGNALRLALGSSISTAHQQSKFTEDTLLEWWTCGDPSTVLSSDAGSRIQIYLPEEFGLPGPSVSFYRSTVHGLKDLTITPPWREGRTPIPVKELLRGQKVPLELRRHAPAIYVINEKTGSNDLVAVYIAPKSSWILDARFTKKEGTNAATQTALWLKIA